MSEINIPWEQLKAYFGYKLPIGVVLILFFMGVLFYVWSSHSLRRGTKVLLSHYKNMIDDLGKENGRHIEEKKQLQGRVTDLESKLLDVIGGKQKREG